MDMEDGSSKWISGILLVTDRAGDIYYAFHVKSAYINNGWPVSDKYSDGTPVLITKKFGQLTVDFEHVKKNEIEARMHSLGSRRDMWDDSKCLYTKASLKACIFK